MPRCVLVVVFLIVYEISTAISSTHTTVVRQSKVCLKVDELAWSPVSGTQQHKVQSWYEISVGVSCLQLVSSIFPSVLLQHDKCE